jgi:hypothetical protein
VARLDPTDMAGWGGIECVHGCAMHQIRAMHDADEAILVRRGDARRLADRLDRVHATTMSTSSDVFISSGR